MNDDPRAIRSRNAILRAVAELVQSEGPGAITHQRVAQQAGVGRATVYRHWKRPEDLLDEAMQQVDVPFLEPSEAPLRERLCTDLRRIRNDLDTQIASSVIATTIDRSRRETSYRERHERIFGRAVVNMEHALDQAMQHGELRASPDAEALVSQLVGVLFFRRLVAHRTTTDAFIDHVIDTALGPWTPLIS